MTKLILTAAAAAALVVSGPLAAQQRSNGQQTREQARQNSQGSANANERARERANQNSAVANVQLGMMVHDRNNKMIGSVTDVRRSSTGVIIAIVVSLTVQINGSSTITLPAGSFTVVAGVVIVTTITAR